MEFVAGYAEQQEQREKLYPLFENVFQLDAALLQDFHRRGFWDPTYTPFTFFQHGQAVANASMFVMPMMLEGERIEVACIQSVMTDPQYRGQGLMKRLMEELLAHIDASFTWSFLFTVSPQLYERFGFEVVPHYTWRAAYSPQRQDGAGQGMPAGRPALRRLSIFDQADVALIRACFAKQAALSQTFAPLAYQSSFFLNMYDSDWQQKLYYAAEHDTLLVFAVSDKTLHLYEVVGERVPALAQICQLVPADFTQVVLHFCPDSFADELAFTPQASDNAAKLMARGPHSLRERHYAWPLPAAF